MVNDLFPLRKFGEKNMTWPRGRRKLRPATEAEIDVPLSARFPAAVRALR